MPSPTPEEIQREQERLELIQKQNAAAKELASTYEKMAKTAGGLNNEEKEILDISKKISKAASETEKSTNKRLDKTSSVKDLNKSIQALQFSQLKNADIANKLEKAKIDAINESLSARVREIDLNKKLAAELDKQQEIQDRIEEIKRAQGPLDKAALALAREEEKSSKAVLDIHEKNLKKTIETKDQQRNLAIQLDDAAKAHQTIIKEQQEELELTKKEIALRQQKSILDALEEKFNVKKIKDMMTLGGLFKVMLESALKFNEISVQISKNLGYGASEANRVTDNLVSVAQNSSNINVTLKNAGEAMNELNTSTGLVAEYSADTLETQIMLTKQFGLQADEAAGIYRLSVLNNKSASDTNKAMVGAFVAARNSFKVGANFKQVMAEAAKVSGQLAATLGYNPERITKAVVAMKAFGTTLEQTKAQGDALLNFESSIENELKAELLTGEQMNLERARAAALAGDQVALAEELANQGMTLEKFSSMNVLAQKAYAEALGLNADQLSDQLQKQKQAEESGKTLAQITEEEALEAQKRQTIQEKFNGAIEKLQDFFGNLVAGPLGKFLDILSTAMGYITSIGAGLAVWYTTSKLIAGSQALIAWYSQQKLIADRLGVGVGNVVIAQLGRMLGISTAKAVAETTAATALSFGTLLPIILGAGAAIYGLISSFKGDDIMSEGGYGKRTLLAPEGAIKLNDKDTVVAGTNLGGGGGGEAISPSIDLTPMIAAINSVKASIDRLYEKDTSVNMDGKKVGSTLTQGSYKVA